MKYRNVLHIPQTVFIGHLSVPKTLRFSTNQEAAATVDGHFSNLGQINTQMEKWHSMKSIYIISDYAVKYNLF